MGLLSNLKNGAKKVNLQQVTNDVSKGVNRGLDFASFGLVNKVAAPLEQRAFTNVQKVIPNIVQNAPKPIQTVANGANSLIVKPLAQLGVHSAQFSQGKNPYTGSNKQIAGQVGADAINLASIVPVGKAAKGLSAAPKGIPLATRALAGAKTGAKFGAAYGGAQGITGGLQQNQNIPQLAKSAAVGAATGAAFGGALGGATPLAGAGARQAVKAATPKYAGLPKSQIIMDTKKLDILNKAKTYDSFEKGNSTKAAQEVITGLHGIKNDHGLDFISGSQADRKQRITQFLEQNGEAIPKLQNAQAKAAARRNTAIDIQNKVMPGLRTNAVNDSGEQLAMNGKPIKSTVSGAEQKIATTPQREGIPLTPPKQPAIASVQGEVPLVKNSGFAAGAQRSAEVSNHVKGILKQNQPQYEQRNTANLQAGSETLTKSPKQLKQLTDSVNERLAVPNGQIDDVLVSDAIAAAKAHDASGNHDLASSIYEGLSPHLTKQGQSIQAASLLSNRTPEGLKFQAVKTLKKNDVKVTPELQKKLDTAYDKLKATAAGSDERFRASQEYAKLVADNLPSSLGDKIAAFWKAGLLTGIKTQTGNALSNGTFGVLHAASNPLAAFIDKGISLKTGVRTKTLTGKGYSTGLKESGSAIKGVLTTGIDERPGLANKYDQSGLTFGNQHGEIKFGNSVAGKAATAYVNGVFRLMGAADRPAYYAQLRNSLADIGKADGINKGLRGKELNLHINDYIKNPPQKPFQVASDEAEKAVLGNDTFLSKAAGSLRQAAGSIENPLGREAAKGALNVTMPFTKVPSAFIGRVLDYTPVGAAKEVIKQASTKTLDQRALSTALSEATTGTAIIGIGIALAKNGLLSGNYPDDPREQARWKAEGIQPNSVKVGNSWKSLNYFGPLGSLFSQGKRVSDTKNEGGNATDVAAGFTGGAVQDALDQSFLQGVSGTLDAVQDPKRYAKSFVNNQAGSVIPTLSKDVAESTDSKQREVNNAGQAIQARIPGIRQGLSAKQDVYGNDLDRKTNAAGTLIDPLRSSASVTNSVKAEVARLHNTDTTNKDLQVTPTPIEKTVTADKQKIKLTDKQRYDLQKQVGQQTQQNWANLIASPEYQKLDDTSKAKALNNLKTDVSSAITRKYVVENNLATYNKATTAKQNNVLDNKVDLAKYASDKTNSSSTVDKSSFYSAPDAEYKALQASYKDKQFNSPALKIAAQQKLGKARVGSSYDKSIRDLYELSKTNINSYLSQSKDGNAEYEKLKAYDQALFDSGFSNTLKFKYGLGTKTASGKRSSGTRVRTAKAKAPKTLFKTSAIKAPRSGKITSRKIKTAGVKLKKNKAIRQKAQVA